MCIPGDNRVKCPGTIQCTDEEVTTVLERGKEWRDGGGEGKHPSNSAQDRQKHTES